MKNKTKDIILSILITILVVIIALFIIGTIENKKESDIKKQNEEIIVKEQLKNSFMSNCVSDGLYEYCSCSFDALYDNLGADGLIRIDQDTENNNGKVTQEVIDIVNVCFDKIK